MNTDIWDVLRNFGQFNKREKYPWRIASFIKVTGV